MTAPRLWVNVSKIAHNARSLVDRLGARGLSVTGVAKATPGVHAISEAMVRAGVHGLGESRIDSVSSLRRAGVEAKITLVRSPMLSTLDQVVAHADVSLNTELEIIRGLSAAAEVAGRIHGIIVMVELGDLREGIMPADLVPFVQEVLRLPGVKVHGIGTNLACRSGVAPDAGKMAELSGLADRLDEVFGPILTVVSGGNSANLEWALGQGQTGRINDLRLGESILLGRDPLGNQPIHGLHTDGFTLTAEVIESKIKPRQPWGTIGRSAFDTMASVGGGGNTAQSILAIGHQDTDPAGLRPPAGIQILGASSDHLVVDTGARLLELGSEIPFQVNYSALLRAAISPFVAKVIEHQDPVSVD